VRSRLIPLSVSPNSDESGKQFMHPDGDTNLDQSLIICSLAHCQPSLKISCKSVRKFLRKDKQRRLHRPIYSLAEVITSLTLYVMCRLKFQASGYMLRILLTPHPHCRRVRRCRCSLLSMSLTESSCDILVTKVFLLLVLV